MSLIIVVINCGGSGADIYSGLEGGDQLYEFRPYIKTAEVPVYLVAF